MAKGDPCGVCGETSTRLVDGFYYCVECGTQDTNVQETVVEQQALADGTFTIARRSRYSVKIKEGVEMSTEWYKWHRHNFLLAGLTEQLIELGAAPSVRMKVLWIWSRYIKKFQKKDEMGPAQALNQLEVSSSSGEEAEEEAEDLQPRTLWARCQRVDRVTNYVVVAILALALNFDRSPILLSHLMRLLRWRLLPVADRFRFVPAAVLATLRARARRVGATPAAAHDAGTLTVFRFLPHMMCRVSGVLGLGGPLTPDVDGVLRGQLRRLRLPAALAPLVRALMHVATVPFQYPVKKETFYNRTPDYEGTVMAYIVVALKMCFGLDDDYERRLSDAVDRINQEAGHPRAYSSQPEPTGRLFSFRSWAAQLRQRALLCARQCAPLAWARGAAPPPDAAIDHFEEFTSARRRDIDHAVKKGARAKLTDQVTMEILDRIPKRHQPGVLPLEALKPAMASAEPEAGVVRAAAPRLPRPRRRLLDEDHTQYSLDYACRRLALPAPAAPAAPPLRGVTPRAARGQRLGHAVYSSLADPATVYVKNCSFRHWARARRPAAAHVLHGDARPASPPASPTGGGERDEDEDKLETFAEEDEGVNIFDDDFSDIPIKEERADSKDGGDVDEAKENINRVDGVDCGGAGVEDDVDERAVFDSDDEVEPRFDPATFNRREVIREMMAAAYKNYLIDVPARFRASGEQRKKNPPRPPMREYMYGVGTDYWANKFMERETAARVERVLAAYGGALPTRAERQGAFPGPEPAGAGDHADEHAPDARDVDESRDVELIENEAKNDKNDDEDSCEEHAYDPVLRSDANLDEKTHDVEQLYVKLPERPPPSPPAERAAGPAPARPAPAGPAPADPAPAADLAAIVDRAIRQMKKPTQKPKERKIVKTDIDHLVEDPNQVRRFDYWFTLLHTSITKHVKFRRFEKEIEENSSRSFWFVLQECSAALGVSPLPLCRLVADIEQRMLRLLPANKRGRNEPKRGARPRRFEPRLYEYPKKKPGRPRKNVDENLSGESGSPCRPETVREDFEDASASRSRPRARKLGRRSETLDGSLSETSDSEAWRPETLSEDSEDSSTSEDQDRPRKRGRPRQTLDKNISGNGSSERERSSEPFKEFGTSKNRDKPRKRGRPLKTLDESSKRSVSQEWRSIKSSNNSEHAQNQDQSKPRKSVGKIISEDSDSDSQDLKPRRSSNDLEDTSTTQNRDQPRNRGKASKTLDGKLSEASDFHEWRPETLSENSEDSSTSEDQDQPRKRGRPRKTLENNILENSYSERERSSKPLKEFSTPKNQDKPRKRGRPRKMLAGSSEDSDSLEWRSKKSSDNLEHAQNQDQPRKRGRPRKTLVNIISEDSDSDSQALKPRRSSNNLEHAENQDQPRKRGRPRKTLVKTISEDSDSDSQHLKPRRSSNNLEHTQNQDQPRKRGRPRKILVKIISEDSDSDSQALKPRRSSNNLEHAQNQDQPRKRGRPRKTLVNIISEDSDTDSQALKPRRSSNNLEHAQNQDQPRKRGRPRKTPVNIISEDSDSDSQALKPRRSSNNLEHAQNQDQPRKRGRPRKTPVNIISEDSDSDSQALKPRRSSNNLEHAQNQDQPRKRGRPRKTLVKIISENSDSDSQDLKPRRSRNDLEDASTTLNHDTPRNRGKTSDSPDSSQERRRKDSNISQNIPRKRGTPHKPLEENLSGNSDRRDCNSERLESSEDSSTMQDRRRKQERPLDETPSEDSDSEQSKPERSRKCLKDESTSQAQDPPRKQGRPLKFLDESVSEDSDSLECQLERLGSDIEDKNTSQNHYPPMTQVKSLNVSDESLSEHSDSQHGLSERFGKASEDVNTSKKKDQPRKPGVSGDSNSENWRPGSSSKYIKQSSTFHTQDQPRNQERLLNSLDESLSDSDPPNRRPETPINSRFQENDSTSQYQEYPSKRGRPRKYIDGKPPGEKLQNFFQDESASQNEEHLRTRGRNTPQNQEHPMELVRPRPCKSLDGNVSEDSDSDKSTPERSRIYSDSSLQEGESVSEKQEYQRKRGRGLSPYQEHPKKRGRPRKSLEGHHSEAITSQRSSPERPHTSQSYRDSSLQEDASLTQNPEHPRTRPRKYVNSNSREESMSQKRIVENLTTYSDSSCGEDETVVQNQEKLRKRGRSVDDNSPEESSSQRNTPEESSISLDSSHQEDKSASRNQEPPRKRKRSSKSMDGSGSLLKATASRLTTPEKQSGPSTYLNVISRSQKEKYPRREPAEATISEVMTILQEKSPEGLKPSKYVEDASDSQKKAPSKQGKPVKSIDFPKISILDRKPETPSTYLNWKPLGNASTPENRGYPNKPERFSKYVDRSLPDISAIHHSTADASILLNKTEECSQTKVISFKQF